jgi:hypothetical protein
VTQVLECLLCKYESWVWIPVPKKKKYGDSNLRKRV